jgi:phage gp16-like protein
VKTLPAKMRQAELAKIHLAKKQLGLDDDTYRAIIERITKGRTDSSGEMTAAERGALLDEFARKGFQVAPPRGRADDWIDVGSGPGALHLKKLLACAYELERIGAVRSGSTKRWIGRFAKKITGVDSVKWLTAEQANKVIEALKGWRKKWLIRHPIAENRPAAAIPAGAKVKAATFDTMRELSELDGPTETVRTMLTLLGSQTFTGAAEGQVAELIREFSRRAYRALRRWDYRKVRSELIWLVARIEQIDPALAEGLRAASLKEEDCENEPADAVRGPRNKKSGGDSI